jgi:predicted nucleotide-binding protein
MTAKKKILWVEDDLYHIDEHIQALKDAGYEVLTASTITESKAIIKSNDLAAIITDFKFSPGDDTEWEGTREGHNSGLKLARWVKDNFPQIPTIGMSAVGDQRTIQWFKTHGAGYIEKRLRINSDLHPFVDYVKGVAETGRPVKHLKMFIVHGRDDLAKHQLKNYLQNTLKFGEPIILHERPSLGRNILEKFEDEASDTDLVFVLLTPDDTVYNSATPNEIKRRARQNVIFEMGYFLAKLERKGGRVLLLYKGELELPSDISGVNYVDITNGVEAAGESIRRELDDLL